MLVGNVARVRVEFKNASHALADPTDVVIKVRDPSGTVTTYDYNPGPIVREATGLYYVDVAADADGEWVGRGIGTGAIIATDEIVWNVEEPIID